MKLRVSVYVHQIPVGTNSVLLIHAITQSRLKVDDEVGHLITHFAVTRDWPEDYLDLARLVPYDRAALTAAVENLTARGFLTTKTPDEERDEIAKKLGATYGRDPVALLDTLRREASEGAKAYWSAQSAQGMNDLGVTLKRIDIIMMGDCDLHMESDFLRIEAARRGYDLRIAATAPDDLASIREHKHDAILIGALYARHFLTDTPDQNRQPHDTYIAQASGLLYKLREVTKAPILIDNLPEPTLEPLGFAESPAHGHRARFRRANLALAELTESFADVSINDIAATLAISGAQNLVDDDQVSFTHMGSPGWMLQRPESEKKAVYNLLPDMSHFIASVGGDPYKREKIIARMHMDNLAVLMGLGRKKCVIVDLDNTLWPGVLAETEAPFAWDPAISGMFSHIGLYFGIHEALLCLKKRGIVLACVSKNDDAVVRRLWHYPDNYPRKRLLTLDDFVSARINWDDKVSNIKSIADELGFAPEAFLFVDDNPTERARVKQFLPEITVWGDDLYRLRRDLLTDPRLQVPKITDESSVRTALVKAQLERQRFRHSAADEDAYRASLQIKCTIDQVLDLEKIDRVEELFSRTTQFNATGLKFTAAELQKRVGSADYVLFTLNVSDKFGDHGLVGAIAIDRDNGDWTIANLVISCRVLGMGVEQQFMQAIIDRLALGTSRIKAQIIETDRNLPVRSIYRDMGFENTKDNLWCYREGNSSSSVPV